MKYLRILFVVLATLTYCSCGDKGSDQNEIVSDNKLSVSPSSLNAAATGQTCTLQIEAGREWAIFASNNENWLSFSPTSGMSGSTQVQVTVKANSDVNAREATIGIKSGNERKYVTLRQEAPLQVSTNKVYCMSVGESVDVTVTTTSNWSASASESWISAVKTNNTTLTITAAANEAFFDRSGEVTVTCGAEVAKIAVKQGSADDRNVTVPLEGYHLVWHDEFGEGSNLNTEVWSHEVQNSGWVNHELQNYVNRTSPQGNKVTEIVDGKLQIHCFKENGKVYSGRVYAMKSTGWTYGYVEAKIMLPSGKGTWPAFWMMPVHYTSWPHDGEIDIMEEVGYHKDYVSSSLHADGHVHTNNTQVTNEIYCKGAEGEFHVYGMEWTPDYFQFYVDGKKSLYYKNPGTGVRDWPYDAPFYVILNLAWGGDWGGNQGVDESALPVTMHVDYVRVFQK